MFKPWFSRYLRIQISLKSIQASPVFFEPYGVEKLIPDLALVCK
jgi:hypothetical protein